MFQEVNTTRNNTIFQSGRRNNSKNRIDILNTARSTENSAQNNEIIKNIIKSPDNDRKKRKRAIGRHTVTVLTYRATRLVK